MADTEWKLEGDRRAVKVTFPTTPPAVLKLGADRLDKLLSTLGEMRRLMTPEVESADWRVGQKGAAILNPRWVAEAELMTGHSLLHIRDPRFGWLHYLIPRHHARELGELLMKRG
jgi:hypothetical protein